MSRDWEQLVARLRAGAAGDVRASAAVELLVAHRHLLERPGFRAACIDGSSGKIACIDWEKTTTAPSNLMSISERALLAVAASLAGPRMVIWLGEVLPALDPHDLGLVLHAQAAAAGKPEIAGALGSWGRG